ncbi:MAG TPA: hypothetical protein VMC84_10230 [Methanocella sp.]|uniref:hypothetical protein n=1 Tax=Methanocella sp. TaxID=2052833 RepID=UPI002D10BFDD|nr:hypothetical protein [Methanocella sp.]HTY91542.1 hypothetical protein [Methanocella sp.]
MERIRALLIAASLIICLSLASVPCGAQFLGAGIALNKHLGDTINFDFGKNIGVGNSAFGLAGLDVSVTWGADYNLAAMAGYPYGYGGLGAVTQGDLGYNLGVTVDAVQGAGFDGSAWGIPQAEQGITRTHFEQGIAENAQINDLEVAYPFSPMLVA